MAVRTEAALEVLAIVSKVKMLVTHLNLGGVLAHLTRGAHVNGLLTLHATVCGGEIVVTANTLSPIGRGVELSDTSSSALTLALIVDLKVVQGALGASCFV